MDVGGAKPIFGPAPRTTKVTVHRETPTAEDDLLAGEWAISPKSIAAFRHLANTLIEDSPSLVFRKLKIYRGNGCSKAGFNCS